MTAAANFAANFNGCLDQHPLLAPMIEDPLAYMQLIIENLANVAMNNDRQILFLAFEPKSQEGWVCQVCQVHTAP